MDSESITQKNSHISPQIKSQESFSLLDSFPPQNKKLFKPPNYYYSPRNKNLKSKKHVFRPKSLIYINNKQKYYNYPKISKKEQDMVFNNLYQDNFYRKDKIRKLSQEKEKRFNTIYTFSPEKIYNNFNESYQSKISKSYSKLEFNKSKNENSLTNFINRVVDYQIKKREHINKIKKEMYGKSSHSKIRKMSSKDFQLPYNSQKYLTIKNEKIKKLSNELLDEQGVTFRPKLYDNLNYTITKSFEQRTIDYQKAKEIKLNNAKEDHECTFSPKINNDNSSTIQNSQSNNNKSISNVGDRLFNYQDQYRKKLEKMKIKNEKSYSFKPKISKNTNIILEKKKRLDALIKEKKLFEEYTKQLNSENDDKNIEDNFKSQKLLSEDFSNNNNNFKLKNNHKKNLNITSDNDKFKKYFVKNQNFLIKKPIPVNVYNKSKTIINESRKNKLEDYLLEKNQFKYINKFKNGRNIFENMKDKEKEKEKPYINCSTSNSKSIVNLNYYDSLI